MGWGDRRFRRVRVFAASTLLPRVLLGQGAEHAIGEFLTLVVGATVGVVVLIVVAWMIHDLRAAARKEKESREKPP